MQLLREGERKKLMVRVVRGGAHKQALSENDNVGFEPNKIHL